MPIETRSDGVFVGRLEDDPQFTADLDWLMALDLSAPPRIVLELSRVRYMNSSNIAKLLRLRKIVVETDGKLVLVSPSPQVWSVLAVTGLDKVFQFSADLTAGLDTARRA